MDKITSIARAVWRALSAIVYTPWGPALGGLGCLIVMIVSWYWPFGKDPNLWAGLGQWVGGAGAFIAAWAALRIARKDAWRQAAQETERRRIQAYYVSARVDATSVGEGIRVCVRNQSPEPIEDVDIVAIHISGQTQNFVLECALKNERKRDVFLPIDDDWRPWVVPTEGTLTAEMLAMATSEKHLPEVVFRDLGGTRWRRIGNRPPTKERA
ncbi:hypothetical protein [Amycolatopsis sp. lyj-112]|uniref:hypothetical protein n=1 Tax=Amycolatopsis sp. lyj-112 TaxID=2789288 RepID=UPI00397AB98B